MTIAVAIIPSPLLSLIGFLRGSSQKSASLETDEKSFGRGSFECCYTFFRKRKWLIPRTFKRGGTFFY